MELTKLARVRIDMPNGLDAEWKIDVKKASAQPPHQVRERLPHLIEDIVREIKAADVHREGRAHVSDAGCRSGCGARTRGDRLPLNRDHPVVADFVCGFPTT